MTDALMVGLVGKPNSGKSTFFNSCTLDEVPTASYPFTTIEPHVGVAHVRTECVCEDLGVDDDPMNSRCVAGNRFVPVKLMDTAGLVPGAWKGKGLGNQFLDEVMRSDVMIQVVDGSGSTDLEGNPTKEGEFDPRQEVRFLWEEVSRWVDGLISQEWGRLLRTTQARGKTMDEEIARQVSGLKVDATVVKEVFAEYVRQAGEVGGWSDEERFEFVSRLVRRAKPMTVAANKVDRVEQSDFGERFGAEGFVPVSAESELALKRASEKGLVDYIPGDSDFEIRDPDGMGVKQRRGLLLVRERVLQPYGSTGVQRCVNTAVLDQGGMITVYPVADASKLTDNEGRVLPDAHLLQEGSTLKDLARKVHEDIAAGLLYGVDAKSGRRIGPDTALEDRSVVRLVSAR